MASAAEALAVAGRQRLGADLAISTVGVAGPEDETPENPVGLVFAGLAWEGGKSSTNFGWTGTRSEVRKRTAKMALNRVRLHLLRAREARVTIAGRNRLAAVRRTAPSWAPGGSTNAAIGLHVVRYLYPSFTLPAY